MQKSRLNRPLHNSSRGLDREDLLDKFGIKLSQAVHIDFSAGVSNCLHKLTSQFTDCMEVGLDSSCRVRYTGAGALP